MPKDYEIKIKTKADGQNDLLIANGTIDLIDSFSHEFKTKFTDVPLEDGSSVVDNAIDIPLRIRMSIVVTNIHTKSFDLAFNQGEFLYQQDSLAIDPNVDSDYLDSDQKALIRSLLLDKQDYDEVEGGRPATSLADILLIKSQRQLLTIDSLLHRYEDMVIENISMDENVHTGTALIARVEMRQIKFATSISLTARSVSIDSTKLTGKEALAANASKNKALKDEEAAKLVEKREAKEAEVRELNEEKTRKVNYWINVLGKAITGA